jgi:hypothetical protein
MADRLGVAAVSDGRIDILKDGLSLLRFFSMPERLKRLDMVYQNSPIYFVTAGTAKRRKMPANEAIHSALKHSVITLQIAAHGSAHTYSCLIMSISLWRLMPSNKVCLIG